MMETTLQVQTLAKRKRMLAVQHTDEDLHNGPGWEAMMIRDVAVSEQFGVNEISLNAVETEKPSNIILIPL